MTFTRKEQFYGSKSLTARVRKAEERYDANESCRLCCIVSVLVEIQHLPGTDVVDFQALSIEQRIAYVKENDAVRLMNLDDLIELLATNLYNGQREPAVRYIEGILDVLDEKKTEIKENTKGITAAKLVKKQFGTIKWFVKNLIPEGLTVIAGQSKIGKSWFLMQLGLCVASGHDFIGGWQCPTNSVLYLSLEDHERRAKARIETLNIPINDNLYFRTEWNDGIDGIDRYFEKYQDVKMIMVDTWGRFTAPILENGNDYQQVTKIAGELHSIAKKHGAAIVLCAHTNKGNKHEDWLNSIMGSKGLVAAADTILSLERKRESTDGKLNVTGRDVWEQTLELTCASNWLWLDNSPPIKFTHLSEFNQFNDVPF